MGRHFGHPDGVSPGQHFDNRIALSLAGVHRPRIAGISGSQAEGCDSIVYCEGYEDDEDHGDYLIYTGAGGRDRKTGLQVMDQEMQQPQPRPPPVSRPRPPGAGESRPEARQPALARVGLPLRRTLPRDGVVGRGGQARVARLPISPGGDVSHESSLALVG